MTLFDQQRLPTSIMNLDFDGLRRGYYEHGRVDAVTMRLALWPEGAAR